MFQGTFSSPQPFYSSIYCTVVTMIDSPTIIESDSEGGASSSSRKRMEPELHSLPSTREDFFSKVISMIKDFKKE